MHILESPHALPDDAGNGHGTAAQHIVGEVLSLRHDVTAHGVDIAALKRGQPYRGVERFLLVVGVVGVFLTLGAVVEPRPRSTDSWRPMTPDDLRRLDDRVRRLESSFADFVREGDARDRRVLSDVRAENAALTESIKRHTDASNAAQLAPVMMRLAQLEAGIARVLASDEEDRALKESMRVALSEHAAVVKAEMRFRQESRIELEAREATVARIKEHRLAVAKVVVPIVLALIGLVSAAVTSHFTH